MKLVTLAAAAEACGLSYPMAFAEAYPDISLVYRRSPNDRDLYLPYVRRADLERLLNDINKETQP